MPTVSWARADAATGSSTPAIVAQALVAAALAQGWTIEYADTNAIGTGSSGGPKFDTVAYSSGASIGRMIIKIPLGPFSTAWVVQIELKWGTVTGGYKFEITSGLSQSAGVLGSPGTVITCGWISSNLSSVEFWVSAHTNELFVSFCAQASFSVGRKRTLSGGSIDDLLLIGVSSSPSNVYGFPAPVSGAVPGAGICLNRSASQGEYTASRALVWGIAYSSTYGGPDTLTDGAGNYGYPIGPFAMGNGVGGFPRLWAIFPTNDIPAALNNFTVTVDGADRLWFVPTGVGSISINNCRWAFAKE